MQIKGKAWLSLALVALVGIGCGKSKTAGDSMPAVDRFSAEATAKAESGDLAGALALLDKGITQVSDPSEKGRLFALELGLLLGQNKLADAEARYLKAAATPADVSLAVQATGFIEGYLARQPEGHSNVLAWCDRLDQAGLPEALQAPVLQNRLSALWALGQFDQALALIETRGWAMPDAVAGGLFGRFIQSSLAAGQLDLAAQALAFLDEKGGKRAGLAALAAEGRIDLAVARADFAGAGDLLFERAALFDDGASAGFLDKIARGALAGGKADASDAVVEKALSAFANRPGTRARAQRWWLLRARDAGDLGMGLDRLEKLDALGVPPAQLAGGVNILSQMVLPSNTPPAAAARMMDFAGRLKARVTEEGDVALLAGVQLDAGFRLEDYAGLVKVLEAGVPGHDAAWHQTMINKVKAHLDLKEGRIDDAVAKFRLFMAAIAAQADQGHRDPITDERVTKDMILGYNASRIGDIYDKAGRAEDAAKAYAEAKADYEKALKGFAAGDPEIKTINEILSGLGKRAGG